jgi:hypothetical protein
MKSIQCAERRIRSDISYSKVPEDPLHAKNTLAWLLKLKPDADDALRLAALGHDVERYIEARRMRKDLFRSFDEFKSAHASNSAKVLRSILEEFGVEERVRSKVCGLVLFHETGRDQRSDILKNAVSLPYFQDNIPFYFVRNRWMETKRRSMWGYAGLSPQLRQILARFRYGSEDLNTLLQEAVTADYEALEI